jgi:hypothetical protein
VNTLLKSLIVWLMLVAVPFQGFASATMLLCTPIPATAAAEPGAQHDHAAMMASQHDHHAARAGDSAPADHHTDHKCGSCAACCLGASMAPSRRYDLAVQPPRFESIPFDSGYQPVVDLAVPERPPKSSLA